MSKKPSKSKDESLNLPEGTMDKVIAHGYQGILGADGQELHKGAPTIITDMNGHRRNEVSEEQQILKQQYECRELVHMMRPLEDMAQTVAVGGGELIFVAQIIDKYPQFADYLQDHHFDHINGDEHLVFNTVAFVEEPELLQALLCDCYFRIVTFARMGGKSMPVRERAAQLMGKIKGIDPEDAVKQLDPELAFAIQQRGQQDDERMH